MTVWQRIEKRRKMTVKTLNRCPVRLKYAGCGFKPPVINGIGQCGGCYNPDDGQLEFQCRGCQHNEYFNQYDKSGSR